MTTWQAKLLGGSYKLVSGDPPVGLDASEFWSVAKDLIPQDVPILLGGCHRRLAPYLYANINSYKTTWHLITTKSASGTGVREPKERVKLIHVFCERYPKYSANARLEADFPGVLSNPSNVLYITEKFGTTPPDVLRFVAKMYGAEESENPMFDEQDVLETPAEILAPAYSVLGSGDDGNMSCSHQLREYVDTLVDSGRELGAIASAVHKVYNESYREECIHRLPGGNTIRAPEWSVDAVRRHLLFTTNENGNSAVFDNYVTQTLQHMIIHQNKVVKPSTGEVDEDSRKSLCNSIETLMKWRTHVRDTRCGKKTSRK